MDLLFLLRVTLCIAICIGDRSRAAADAVDIVTGWRSAHPEQFKKLRITRGPTQKRTQVMQAPLTKKAKNRTRTTGKRALRRIRVKLPKEISGFCSTCSPCRSDRA